MGTGVEKNMGPTKGGFKIVIHGDGFGVSAEEEQNAMKEGKKQEELEKAEEKAEADKENKEIEKEKKKSAKEIGEEFADDAKSMMDSAKKLKNETEEENIALKEEAKVADDLRKQEEAGEIREIMQGENKAAKEARKVRSERASEAQNDKKTLAKAKEAQRKARAQMEAARTKVVASTEKEEDGGAQPNTKKMQMKAKVDETIRQAQQSGAASRKPKEQVISEAVAELIEITSTNRRSKHHRAGRKHMHRAHHSKNLAAETYLVPESNIYDLDEHRFRELSVNKSATKKKKKSMVQLKGKYPPHIGVWIGKVKCLNISWVSNKRVECIVPPGVGSQKITVRAPADVGVKARGNISVEYDPADVGDIQPNHGPMHGGYTIEIAGKSFGVNKTAGLTAYIGSKTCVKTTWVSDNRVDCVVP